MTETDPIDDLTQRVIGCAIAVHRAFGPGLLESVYVTCLAIEMAEVNLRVQRQREIPLTYRGQKVPGALRMDLIVEDKIIVEVKAVDRIHAVHLAQVVTYLKLTGYPAGLLMNFNAVSLVDGLRRLEHPDRYLKKRNKS